MRSDPNGEWVHVVVGAAIGGFSSYIAARACGNSCEEAFKSALWGAASGAASALLPGAGAAIDVGFNIAETVVNDVRNGESYGTIVADSFVAASFGAISGSSNSYIATKQATKEISSAVNSIPEMLAGNHPSVRTVAKKGAEKTLRKAGRSIASMLGLSSIANWANGKIRNWWR